MTRFNIKERIPISISDETKVRASIYSKLALAALTLVVGATLALSGLVLIPMMAFAYEVMAVIGAAAMATVGAGLAGAAYIWLTGPV